MALPAPWRKAGGLHPARFSRHSTQRACAGKKARVRFPLQNTTKTKTRSTARGPGLLRAISATDNPWPLRDRRWKKAITVTKVVNAMTATERRCVACHSPFHSTRFRDDPGCHSPLSSEQDDVHKQRTRARNLRTIQCRRYKKSAIRVSPYALRTDR